jgi:hypothetical protein
MIQIVDVTAEREAQEQLSYQAFHDALTGLRNRAWILDMLEVDLRAARRTSTSVGVFFIDLDNFKLVNDSLGHAAGDEVLATVADRITAAFRTKFWAGDHCVEYINAEHGAISHHGLTDVDWAAIATGLATPEQVKILWPQLRTNRDFVYNGIPTGISTRPETYEDWEMMYLDRHDLAAMGRVWYVEAWARSVMGDREGVLESLRQVARVGRENNWYWRERYYSERSGDLGSYRINTYCEYPANFIRIVHRFVLGA